MLQDKSMNYLATCEYPSCASQAQANVMDPVRPQRIAMVGTLTQTMLGFRSELIRDLIRSGHQVFAFCCDWDDISRAQMESIGGKPIDYPLNTLGTEPLSDLKSIRVLTQKFRQLNISMSYCFFSKPAIYGTIAAKRAGVPVRVAKLEGLGRVFTPMVNENLLQRAKKKLIQFTMLALYRFAFSRASQVFLLNEQDYTDLNTKGVLPANTKVTGGIGVCLHSYAMTPVPIDPIRFIFVGRLLLEKGIRYYLIAAERIKARYPNAEFVVLGEPESLKKSNQAVTRGELLDYVKRGIIIYPGRVGNVSEWLVSSSVFVLPSYYREGVPRSTQEALAVGRAVITTDMPGCRDTVQHKVNGFLIEPHDQQALENAMEYCIVNPGDIATMGQASAHLAASRFDVEKKNAEVISLLHELVEQNASLDCKSSC